MNSSLHGVREKKDKVIIWVNYPFRSTRLTFLANVRPKMWTLGFKWLIVYSPSYIMMHCILSREGATARQFNRLLKNHHRSIFWACHYMWKTVKQKVWNVPNTVKIANRQAHSVARCDALWACRSVAFIRLIKKNQSILLLLIILQQSRKENKQLQLRELVRLFAVRNTVTQPCINQALGGGRQIREAWECFKDKNKIKPN